MVFLCYVILYDFVCGLDLNRITAYYYKYDNEREEFNKPLIVM